MPAERVIIPTLDEAYDLGARAAKAAARRVTHEHVGRRDWHTDLSKLLLDISEKVGCRRAGQSAYHSAAAQALRADEA